MLRAVYFSDWFYCFMSVLSVTSRFDETLLRNYYHDKYLMRFTFYLGMRNWH